MKKEKKYCKTKIWDTFERISQRTGTDAKKLQKLNPGIKQGFLRYNMKVRYK